MLDSSNYVVLLQILATDEVEVTEPRIFHWTRWPRFQTVIFLLFSYTLQVLCGSIYPHPLEWGYSLIWATEVCAVAKNIIIKPFWAKIVYHYWPLRTQISYDFF